MEVEVVNAPKRVEQEAGWLIFENTVEYSLQKTVLEMHRHLTDSWFSSDSPLVSLTRPEASAKGTTLAYVLDTV